MARILLTNNTDGLFRFPASRRRDAFAACELLAPRLEMEVQVVRKRDEETRRPFFAIALDPKGRSPTEDEIAEALEICHMVRDK